MNRNNNSDDDSIIQFEDDDNKQNNNHNQANFKHQTNIRKQSEEEIIIHEPGMQQINQQEQQLNTIRLNKVKTSGQEMKIQKQEQQYQEQQQQNQFEQIQQRSENQSEELPNNSDEREQDSQSMVDFKSENGEQVEQENYHQQIQPNQQQGIEDNPQQFQQQEQPPPQSITQGKNNPFPPKLEISYVTSQMKGEDNGRSFLTTPLQQNRTLQCYIKRDKSGLARIYPIYHVYTTEGDVYLFSAKKVVMNTTSNYIISMKKNEFSTRKESFLGKVKSNFLGTEFILWDEGKHFKKSKDISLIRHQLGVVYYESHIMQNKSPRKMTVLIPKVGEQNIPKMFQPLHSKEGIQYDYQYHKREYIEEFINKPPRWDDKMKAHVLNFYGRVEQPSVKNFQLVKPDDHQFIYLQFGRVDDLLFNLDFCFPLSPLQAFQICVTSFDFKFACE